MSGSYSPVQYRKYSTLATACRDWLAALEMWARALWQQLVF